MKKVFIIIFVVQFIAVATLVYLLYQAHTQEEVTTVVIPGDNTYHAPVTSAPKPIQEISPVKPVSAPAHIIIYVDTGGNRSIDTNAIIRRFAALQCERDSLWTALLTIRTYSDTIDDTAAKVKAVIRDSVTNNRLQKGRLTYFMNYRPVSMKITTQGRKGALLWGVAAGYNYQGDPLFGINLDYLTGKTQLFGITLGTGFVIPRDRLLLLRYSQKF